MGHVASYFPDQGSNPHPLQWKHGVLTTAPPGKSLLSCFKGYLNKYLACWFIYLASFLPERMTFPRGDTICWPTKTCTWKLQPFLEFTAPLIFLKHYFMYHVPARNLCSWLSVDQGKKSIPHCLILWQICLGFSFFPFLSNMHSALIRQVSSLPPETFGAWLQIMAEIPSLCLSKFYSPFKDKIIFLLKSHVSSEPSQSLLSLPLTPDALIIMYLTSEHGSLKYCYSWKEWQKLADHIMHFTDEVLGPREVTWPA